MEIIILPSPAEVGKLAARRIAQLIQRKPATVLGRDIHRDAFARAAVDELRARHAEVLVVDMGWPSDDRRYADVATYGSSALISQALLMLLTEG